MKDVIDVARVSLLLTLDMFLQLPLNNKCLMDTGFKQSYIDWFHRFLQKDSEIPSKIAAETAIYQKPLHRLIKEVINYSPLPFYCKIFGENSLTFIATFWISQAPTLGKNSIMVSAYWQDSESQFCQISKKKSSGIHASYGLVTSNIFLSGWLFKVFPRNNLGL